MMAGNSKKLFIFFTTLKTEWVVVMVFRSTHPPPSEKRADRWARCWRPRLRTAAHPIPSLRQPTALRLQLLHTAPQPLPPSPALTTAASSPLRTTRFCSSGSNTATSLGCSSPAVRSKRDEKSTISGRSKQPWKERDEKRVHQICTRREWLRWWILQRSETSRRRRRGGAPWSTCI